MESAPNQVAHDQVNAILLRVIEDLLRRMAHGDLETRLQSLSGGLRLQSDELLLVMRLRVFQNGFGLHVIAELGRAGDGQHPQIGTVFPGQIERVAIRFGSG